MPRFPFDAVLFDCDGVLVDSEPLTARVLSTMLTEIGWPLTPEEAAREFIGKTLKDHAHVIEARTQKPFTLEWLAEFRRRRNAVLASELTEIDGAGAAVRAVSEATGGRIACASGADMQKVRMQLTKIGLIDAFDGHIFSGDDMARSKPHPDVYLAAAAALRVSPSRCAVIEDTVTGTAAGVAAGATVFGYAPGGVYHSSADALISAGATATFERMSDLLDVLTVRSRAS